MSSDTETLAADLIDLLGEEKAELLGRRLIVAARERRGEAEEENQNNAAQTT
jgi:hypothetical protein